MVVVRIDSADWLQTVSRWLLTIRVCYSQHIFFFMMIHELIQARGPNSSVLIVGTHSESLATLQDPSFEAKRIKQEVLHFQYKISDCPRLEDFIMVSFATLCL